MIDVSAPDVPDLSDDWISLRRDHLLRELRRHHRSRVLRRAAVFGAGVVAASVATTLVLSAGPGTVDAFAGWVAVPTSPTIGQLASAETACQSLNPHGHPWISGAQQPVVADTRGPFTLLVYTGNGLDDLCLSGPSLTVGGTDPTSAPVAPDNITVAGELVLQGGGPYFTMAVGGVGAGVSGVTLALGNRSTVETTVSNGYFVAWWPGEPGADSAQITTPSGVSTQELGPTPPAGT